MSPSFKKADRQKTHERTLSGAERLFREQTSVVVFHSPSPTAALRPSSCLRCALCVPVPARFPLARYCLYCLLAFVWVGRVWCHTVRVLLQELAPSSQERALSPFSSSTMVLAPPFPFSPNSNNVHFPFTSRISLSSGLSPPPLSLSMCPWIVTCFVLSPSSPLAPMSSFLCLSLNPPEKKICTASSSNRRTLYYRILHTNK